MSMNLSYLRYAVEIQQTQSITKAAQNLYMGQPNLSKAVKELEQEIGISLFRRTPHGVVPTQKGEEFLRYARTILSQVDELESLYRKPEKAPIRFTVSVPRATYVSVAFAEFARRFQSEKQLQISMKETSSLGAVNDVVIGDSEIGLIRWQKIYEDYYTHLLQENSLHYEVIWEFTLCLLMSEKHPLASMPEIPYHMLGGYTEITQGDFQLPSLAFSKIKKSAVLEAPPKRISIYDRGSQYDLLQRDTDTYMWVSPIPHDVLKQHHLVTRNCPLAEVINKDVIIYPKNQKPSPIGKAFIDTIYKSAEAMAAGQIEQAI